MTKLTVTTPKKTNVVLWKHAEVGDFVEFNSGSIGIKINDGFGVLIIRVSELEYCVGEKFAARDDDSIKRVIKEIELVIKG